MGCSLYVDKECTYQCRLTQGSIEISADFEILRLEISKNESKNIQSELPILGFILLLR